MSAQTFEFQRYPAERARRLQGETRGGGRRALTLLAIASGGALVLSGASMLEQEPRAVAVGLIVAGGGLLVATLVAAVMWLIHVLCAPGRPWGRLLTLGLLAVSFANLLAVQQHRYAWLPILNGLGWILAIGLLLRLGSITRPKPNESEAERWQAGAVGEDIVARALAPLGAEHVVIHNLPLAGRGDADHVVIGPAGVLVVETKFFAGRLERQGGQWVQVAHGQMRYIADPTAQVERAAATVARMLERRGLSGVPVGTVLVMAHPRAEFDAADSLVPVLRPFELVHLLQRLAAADTGLDGRTVTAIADVLLSPHLPVRGVAACQGQ